MKALTSDLQKEMTVPGTPLPEELNRIQEDWSKGDPGIWREQDDPNEIDRSHNKALPMEGHRT